MTKKDVDELYEKDLVYRTLVDNYVKYSNPKNGVLDENASKALNALATYTNKLQDNSRLEFVKSFNFTNEDIAEMWKQGILSPKIISKMIEFKKASEKESESDE